ncbi:outer membrane beta-barrel protein [Pseudoflavitalea sp. G-6-1-2]|uniref:outer membrane beta-barrel protein n=1 Tax=Pseudoflavitalea sp. G-6-1-2 TaxID=2728841 RepID=UPI00146EF68E|nr:outer membrane beta-barrel protein [Pseudoflavitalea sp. G-6-1-2]NML22225.1 outer membrane beta-barrel protein [Pseudoflavitalea sp. G-6-1-2]
MQTSFAKTVLPLLIMCLLSITAFSQNSLKGKVVDSSENKKLQHAIVALIDLSDTTLYRSWRTDAQGNFSLTEIPKGHYQLMISYPKMADFLQTIPVDANTHLDLGNINMLSEAKLMEEVIVTAGKAIRMKGDTLEYTADSFAVRQGANVEALLKRLPGIQVTRNGQLLSNGQEIRKMLVDGEEFFTDDPRFAMQYLKAHAVDKVQVYDRKSDESMLTGFDDGQKTKTMNLKLKDGYNKGYFGRLATGASGEGQYRYEGMIGAFQKRKRMGVYGIAAKTMDRFPGFGMTSRIGGGGIMTIIDDGIMGSFSSADHDRVDGGYGGAGIPSTVNGGAHFSDKFSKGKNAVTSSYNYSNYRGNGWSGSTSYTKLTDSTSILDDQHFADNGNGTSHMVNASVQFNPDSASQINIRLDGGIGNNETLRETNSSSVNQHGMQVNSSDMDERARSEEKKFNTSISYFRKLKKIKSSLSFQFDQLYGNSEKDNNLLSVNKFYNPGVGSEETQTLDRLQAKKDNYQSYGGRLKFTSRLIKGVVTQLEYGMKSRMASSRFNTLNGSAGKYEDKVDSLSNNYDLTTLTQIIGGGIQLDKKGFSLVMGANTYLSGYRQTDVDNNKTRSRNFTNLAPYLRSEYRLTNSSSVSLGYNGKTIQPTLDQIQPLQRSSNLLFIQEGNPDLAPGFTHAGGFHYNLSLAKKNLFITIGPAFSISTRTITNSTVYDAQNRRVSKYVNVDGLPSYSGNINITKTWRKSGWNTGGRVSYSKSGFYLLQNNQQYRSNSSSWNFSGDLGYRLNEDLSFRLSSGVNLNNGTSTLSSAAVTRTLTHFHNVSMDGVLPGDIEFRTDFSANFNPSNNSFAKSIDVFTWNAGFSRKFLKNKELMVSLQAYDLLNNNTGYKRTVDGLNWSEQNGFVLKRYFMLTVSWDFAGSL